MAQEKITRERLEQIFEDKETNWKGDNAFQGLQIIAEYFDIKNKTILAAAGREVIYSVDVDEAIEAGLTEEDANKLAELNWMIDEDFDCLACFV